MADMFSYTPTESIVQPTSATIQKTPNMQAANAFKTLQNTISGVMQEQTRQVQRESQVLNEQMQLQRQVNAATDAQKKAQTEALELERQNSFFGVLRAIDGQYKADLSQAGENILKKGEATKNFVTAWDEAFMQADPKDQKSARDYYYSTRDKVVGDYTTSVNTLKKDDLWANISVSLPVFNSMTEKAGRDALYNNWKTAATNLGITPKEFGDDFAKLIASHLVLNIDEQKLINESNFDQITSYEQIVKGLASTDPRAKEAIDAAYNKIDGLRVKANGVVNSNIDLAISTKDRATFDKFVEVARKNNTMPEEVIRMKHLEYAQKEFSQAEQKKIYAAKLVQASNNAPVVAAVPEELRESVTNLVEDDLKKNLFQFGGTYDLAHLQEVARNAPVQYDKIYGESLDNLIDIIKTKSRMEAKTPEQIQQKSQMMAQYYDALDKHLEASFRPYSEKRMMDVAIIRTLVQNNEGANINDIFLQLKEAGGAKAVSEFSELGQTLAGDVPQDMYQSALRALGALRTVMDEKTAYDIVTQSHSFIEVEGIPFEMSNPVSQKLNSTGVATQAMGQMMNVLTDPNFFYSMQNEDSTDRLEVVRNGLKEVTAGSNPRARMLNGGVYIKNDEGASVLLNLTDAQWKAIGEEATKRDRALREPSTGLGRLGQDIAQGAAPMTTNAVDRLASLGIALTSPILIGASYLPPNLEAIGNAVSALGSSINQTFDEVWYKGRSFNDAAKDSDKRVIAIWNKFLDEQGVDIKESRDAFMEKLIPQLNLAEDTLHGGLEAFVDFFVSNAEANADVTPEGGYYGQGKVTFVEPETFNSDAFYTNIAVNAEGRHGYSAKTKTYTPVDTNDAAEANKTVKSQDIGYGHKITDAEAASGRIHGIPFKNIETGIAIPLTETQAQTIFKKDVAQNLAGVLGDWNKKIGKVKTGFTFADVSPKAQAVLSSLAYNVGSTTAKEWSNIFNNEGIYYDSISKTEVAQFASDLRREDAGKKTAGMDNRVMKELVSAGFINDEETYKLVKAKLPLQTAYPTFASVK